MLKSKGLNKCCELWLSCRYLELIDTDKVAINLQSKKLDSKNIVIPGNKSIIYIFCIIFLHKFWICKEKSHALKLRNSGGLQLMSSPVWLEGAVPLTAVEFGEEEATPFVYWSLLFWNSDVYIKYKTIYNTYVKFVQYIFVRHK